jgi:hypothetical protein
MTDANYANLSTLKGELKRAAIDAYMKSEGWFVPRDDFYGYEEDTLEGSGAGVSKPGKNGEGGGDWTGNKIAELFVGGSRDREYRQAFDDVRSRIDGYLKPWEDLPGPETFESYVEDMRKANGRLAVSTSSDGGVVTGAGHIGAQLTIIEENSTAMSGGTISAFKSKFLLELGKAIGGHHGLTVILGQALTGEQNLMRKAREDVAQAVANATKALDAYAHDEGGGELSFTFKVAGAVVAGAIAFATGGATVLLSGAAAGLTLLTTVAEKGESDAKEPKDKDYEGLMNGFKDVLDTLDRSITKEEGNIRDNLKKNLTTLRADEPSYNLTNPLQNISDDSQLDNGQGKAIIHNRSLVREITGTAMPTIADELVKAKELVWTAWSANPYYRDASVGLGDTGPFPEWADVAGPLWMLIGDLEWEVRNGAKTLDLAIEDMGRVDTDNEDALEKHARSIKDYTNYKMPK